MKKKKLQKAYELKCCANLGKLDDIIELFSPYRSAAEEIAPHQWRYFFQHGCFDRNLSLKYVKTNISKRYRQTCQYQVVSVLNSFIENRKNDFVDIAMRSSLSKETKMILCYINKHNLWFNDKIKLRKESVPIELIKLARKIFKHVLSKHNKPSFKNINMNLDAKVVTRLPSDNHFDYWLKFSILNTDKNFKRDPIFLPLQTNHYFETQPGKIANFVQVNIDKYDQLHFCLIKQSEPEKYEALIKEISLDIGLKILFATSEGDLFGRNFYKILSKYDNYITKLASKRQSHGLRVRCKEYDLMVDNLKEYLKNEINRCLNKIIEIYRPGRLVVENLNFTHMGLSKRMNRLLSRFGLGIIKKKLKALEEKFKIEIVYVNPAYTSQQCSCCGYVAKTNRKTRDRFVCDHCKRKIHADVNGARSTLSRGSDKGITIYMSKEKVLDVITKRFYNCRVSLASGKICIERQSARCPSRWASKLMSRNLYYTRQSWFDPNQLHKEVLHELTKNSG